MNTQPNYTSLTDVTIAQEQMDATVLPAQRQLR